MRLTAFEKILQLEPKLKAQRVFLEDEEADLGELDEGMSLSNLNKMIRELILLKS